MTYMIMVQATCTLCKCTQVCNICHICEASRVPLTYHYTYTQNVMYPLLSSLHRLPSLIKAIPETCCGNH